jgi:hypothetical protein
MRGFWDDPASPTKIVVQIGRFSNPMGGSTHKERKKKTPKKKKGKKKKKKKKEREKKKKHQRSQNAQIVPSTNSAVSLPPSTTPSTPSPLHNPTHLLFSFLHMHAPFLHEIWLWLRNLVDLLLLVDREGTGAHVDEQDQAAAVEVARSAHVCGGWVGG